jgi:hypothetical protein
MKTNKLILNNRFILLIALCIIIWLIGICLTYILANTPSLIEEKLLSNSGLLGDTAGAINALFSALAFAGTIYIIILQKKELLLQHEELEQTREELKKQREEFKEQNETLRRQRFENTFFQMLGLQQKIVESLKYQHEYREEFGKDNNGRTIRRKIKKEETGRDVFYFLFEEEDFEIDEDGYDNLRDAINRKGIEFYNKVKYLSCFDHYFRHLYRIIKFIDETQLIEQKEKCQYTNMVRATLSEYELLCLFYNCLSQYGYDKFKPLVEKYTLLKNIRFELLVKQEDRVLYLPHAYNKYSIAPGSFKGLSHLYHKNQ